MRDCEVPSSQFLAATSSYNSLCKEHIQSWAIIITRAKSNNTTRQRVSAVSSSAGVLVCVHGSKSWFSQAMRPAATALNYGATTFISHHARSWQQRPPAIAPQPSRASPSPAHTPAPPCAHSRASRAAATAPAATVSAERAQQGQRPARCPR